ncbi:MAG: DUF3332 domain-containing protein [Muribaculaceae bacterium]|nr:DUF3332 domain-containing protein [Muribaculaceae bacterium]
MKKKKCFVAMALLLASSIAFQSCIGSFSLTHKVLKWNKQVSNKFVNELVFIAFWVLPVYEVTAVADLLVINSIEFWSGNKPLEANNRVIDTEQGKYYIASSQTGYDIISPDGGKIRFDYDAKTQMWSFSKDDGEKIDFLQFEDENHVKILDTDGKFVDVELNQDGIDNYKYSHLMPIMAQL